MGIQVGDMIYQKDYFGFIYCWIDSTNNKTYTGSHYGSINDGYIGSGIVFKQAFKKRPEAFNREILEYVYEDSKDVLLEVEQKYLNLINWSNTYNLLPFARGGSVKGRIILEKTKQKMKGNTNGKGNKGKTQSARSNQKRSEALKGKTYEEIYGPEKASQLKELRRKRGPWNKGISCPKKVKQKISKKLKGKPWTVARRNAQKVKS